MSRLVHRPISVQVIDHKPVAFIDDDATHEIERIRDWWQESGEWWSEEKSRTIYQVISRDGYMYDIEQQGDGWWIYRVWD
jgi:hypothetical protein